MEGNKTSKINNNNKMYYYYYLFLINYFFNWFITLQLVTKFAS